VWKNKKIGDDVGYIFLSHTNAEKTNPSAKFGFLIRKSPYLQKRLKNLENL